MARAVGYALSRPCCSACDAILDAPAIFCPACSLSVVWAPTSRPSSGLLASVLYGGSPAVALRRLKYGARPDLAEPLAALLRTTLRRIEASGDLIVPIPLHPRRLVERGYNQAALLGGLVARELSASLACDVLHRARDTPPQVGLPRAQRQSNVQGAFAACSRRLARAGHVWLVDDVCTTGATLEAARRALLDAGAGSVRALVVARAES